MVYRAVLAKKGDRILTELLIVWAVVPRMGVGEGGITGGFTMD